MPKENPAMNIPDLTAIKSPCMIPTNRDFASYTDDISGWNITLHTDGTKVSYQGKEYTSWEDFPEELKTIIQTDPQWESHKYMSAWDDSGHFCFVASSPNPRFELNYHHSLGEDLSGKTREEVLKSMQHALDGVLQESRQNFEYHSYLDMGFCGKPPEAIGRHPFLQAGETLATLHDHLGHTIAYLDCVTDPAATKLEDGVYGKITVYDLDDEPRKKISEQIYDFTGYTMGEVKAQMEEDLRAKTRPFADHQRNEALRQNAASDFLHQCERDGYAEDIIEAWNALHPFDDEKITDNVEDLDAMFDHRSFQSPLDAISDHFDKHDECFWLNRAGELSSGDYADAIAQVVDFKELARAISWKDQRLENIPLLHRIEPYITVEYAIQQNAVRLADAFCTEDCKKQLAQGIEYMLHHDIFELVEDVKGLPETDKKTAKGYEGDDYLYYATQDVIFQQHRAPSAEAKALAGEWLKGTTCGDNGLLKEPLKDAYAATEALLSFRHDTRKEALQGIKNMLRQYHEQR